MKTAVKRITMGIGGMVVAALLLALAAPKAVHAIVSTLVTVVNTSSNPVPVQNVKQSADNFVTLNYNGSTYDQVLPDGSTTPFSISSGQQFVITDVSWVTFCSHTFVTCTKSVGDAVVVTLGSANAFSSGPFTSQATYVGNGFLATASSNVSLNSGIVVTQPPLPSILLGASGNGEEILTVTLHGYLVP